MGNQVIQKKPMLVTQLRIPSEDHEAGAVVKRRRLIHDPTYHAIEWELKLRHNPDDTRQLQKVLVLILSSPRNVQIQANVEILVSQGTWPMKKYQEKIASGVAVQIPLDNVDDEASVCISHASLPTFTYV